MLESNESVAANRYSPLHWAPHISTQHVTVKPNDCVRKRRNCESPERRPHHWCWGNVAPDEVRVWSSERIANQDGRSGTQSSAEEEVEKVAVTPESITTLKN